MTRYYEYQAGKKIIYGWLGYSGPFSRDVK